MRRPSLALGAAFVSVFMLGSAPALAQPSPPLSVTLEAPPTLAHGDRATVLARVEGAGVHPILLTPRSEGTAVEVVRGRLTRRDARATDEADETVLELPIPVVARSPGAAVLRVVVSGYLCEQRCRAVRAEASIVLSVLSATRHAARQSQPASQRKKQARERTSSLSWVRLPGAEDCPGSAPLAQAIEARLERRIFVSAAEAGLSVEGRAERDGESWRAVLTVADEGGERLGERTLESRSETCEELGEMVTVTVALMIDPLTAPEQAPEETPATPTPEPTVVVRTERVEVPGVVEVPAEPEPGPRWRIEVDTALVGQVGLLPGPMFGGMAAVTVEPPGFIPITLSGAIFPWSRAEPGGNAFVDFLQFHAGLMLCPLAIREGGLALHGCLGADAGGVFVVGASPTPTDETERVIGQGHAVLRGHWDVIGPLTIRMGVHLLVPFRHEPFTRGGAAFYAPEPVAGMLDLGVGLHFP